MDIDNNKQLSLEVCLKKNWSSFSETQKQIATFLLTHPNEAQFFSMSELASIIGVSNSAISRFIKKAGFKSHNELRVELALFAKSKAGIADRLSNKLLKFDEKDGFFEGIITREQEYISNSIRLIDSSDIVSAAKAIADSGCVYIWAQRPYWGLADILDYRMTRLSIPSIPIYETRHYVLDRAHNLRSNDVVIGFSFQRIPEDIELLFSMAKSVGARTILITDLAFVTKSVEPDIVFSAPKGPYGEYNSYAVPILILHAMLVAVGYELSGERAESLKKLDAISKKYNIHNKNVHLNELM